MSSLIAWCVLVVAGVVLDVISQADRWSILAPIPLAVDLVFILLLSCIFLPFFFIVRRFGSGRAHPLRYITVGAISALLMALLWRTLSGVPVSLTQYGVESIFAIAIGAYFGYRFKKAQKGSEHKPGPYSKS